MANPGNNSTVLACIHSTPHGQDKRVHAITILNDVVHGPNRAVIRTLRVLRPNRAVIRTLRVLRPNSAVIRTLRVSCGPNRAVIRTLRVLRPNSAVIRTLRVSCGPNRAVIRTLRVLRPNRAVNYPAGVVGLKERLPCGCREGLFCEVEFLTL